MNKNVRFHFRFFLMTFMWSWIIWTPLILASLKIIPVSEKLLSILTIPVIMIGVFGPLAGALFALHKENGKGSAKIFLLSFLDFRLGWKVWVFPIIIFGGSTFIAWFFPELFGEERLPRLLSPVWLFVPYLLIMILLGGGQEEFGWRGYALPILENKFGIWLANIILAKNINDCGTNVKLRALQSVVVTVVACIFINTSLSPGTGFSTSRS